MKSGFHLSSTGKKIANYPPVRMQGTIICVTAAFKQKITAVEWLLKNVLRHTQVYRLNTYFIRRLKSYSFVKGCLLHKQSADKKNIAAIYQHPYNLSKNITIDKIENGSSPISQF